jgi:hypothetical protein
MLIGHEIEEISSSLREREENKLYGMMVDGAFQSICPPVLTQLLLNNLIDKTKIHDRDYLLSKLRNYSKEVESEDVFFVVIIYDEFIEAAKDAIKADKNEVAIILISTAIEHILNINYRYLMRYRKISDEVIYNVIKRFNFSDKVGWLLEFIFDLKLDKSFLRDITAIIEIRNAIIHFKSVPITFADVEDADSLTKIRNDIQKIDLNNMLLMPKKLDNLLKAQKFKLFPELLLIKEIMKTIFDDEFKFDFEETTCNDS